MDKEAEAGLTRDTSAVSHLYASDATVADKACLTQGASPTWKGWGEIAKRYQDLPEFDALHHVDVSVNWVPANRWATRAEATAETIGVIAANDAQQKSQAIAGREKWIFVKTDDRWLIESFTYNLCLQ